MAEWSGNRLAVATLSLLPAMLLLVPPQVELEGCEAAFDLVALERQLRIEWAEPAPEAARVSLKCRVEPNERGWRLTLRVFDQQRRGEPIDLPELSSESLVRVLALIIVERARALASYLPAPARQPLHAAASPAPAQPAAEQQPPAHATGSPLRGALFGARLTDEEVAPWRVGLGGGSQTTLWLGPWRFGPHLRVQRGFLGVSVAVAWGSRQTALGTTSPFSLTVEPEANLACVTARVWQACAGVRGVVGYGAINASSTLPKVTAGRVEGPVLGAATQLGASFRLSQWLAVDVDGVVGGAWAVFASSDGAPVAAIGGGFAGGQLTLSASWGAR